MRKFGSLLLGGILGGLVGAAFGLLFAPAPGEQTRHEIEDYFTNIQAEVKRAADEKRAELEEQLRSLRSSEDVTV